MPGTGVFGGTGICHLESNTTVSDRGTLYSATVSIAAVFYIVLEFCKIGCADSGGAAIGRCSGSMGICCISGKREKLAVYNLCGFNAAAVSGNNAVKLFNIK